MSLIKLNGNKLQEIIFKECKFVGTEFYRCEKLNHVKFLKCILQTCNFTDLKLKGFSFKASKLKEVHFSNTDLSEADFSDTDLLGTIFHQCNLTKANFRDAKNYQIDFATNNLKKAKFTFPDVINLLKSLDIEWE